MPAKRTAGGTAEQGSAKKAKVPTTVEGVNQRFLVAGDDQGTIIGKGGAAINATKEATNTYIQLVKRDGIMKDQDRVMVIRGSPPATGDAITLITAALIEYHAKGGSSQTFALRMLLHMDHVGGVIGKAGAIVTKLKADTGANIHLASEPFPGTTEKLVTVTGTSEQIGAAVCGILEITTKLNVPAHTVHYLSTDAPPGAGLAMPMSPMQPHPFALQQGLPPSVPQGYSQAIGAPGAGPPLGAPQVQKILIPSAMAGAVMGKKGANINGIRAQFGLQTLTMAPQLEATPEDRTVILAGEPHMIIQAIQAVYSVVESATKDKAALGGTWQLGSKYY